MANLSKKTQSKTSRFSSVLCLWVLGTLALTLGAPIFPAHASDRITAIEVEGNSKIEKEQILRKLKSSVGGAFSRETVHQDLKTLYGLGNFTDVQIEKENAAGGVRLIVRVVEKPIVSTIVIQGAKKVTEDKVRAEIVQKQFQILDEAKIAESKSKIKELYSKEGLGFVVINTELKKVSKNESELIFKIAENKGLRIEKVTFEGNQVFSTSKLGRMVKSRKHSIISFLTGSGKFRDEMLERDVAFITYSYLNEGYLKAHVEKPEPTPLPNGKGIELKFKIYEGERYKISRVKVSGDILTTEQEVLSKITTRPGQYYSQKLLEDDLQNLTEFYGNQGYAFANIRPQPIPNDATKEAEVQINIEKGQKINIERINISGNTITRDKVIRRELKVAENSLYNETLVKRSKRAVEALGFFENVEVSTPKGSADDKLDLNIKVKEKPTGSFSLGAGYSTSESFVLTASVSKQNFLGLGIGGSILAEISKKRQQFSLQYYDPYFLDTRWILNTYVSKLLTRYDDFDRNSLGGEINLGHRFFDFSSVTLGYKIENVEVSNFSLIVPQFFKKDTNGLTSSLVVAAERDSRNNRITPSQGSYNRVSFEYAGLGGDNHFLRFDANSRWFFPMPLPKGSVLKLNGRVGFIKSLDDHPVPLFERYFTGGINSLRGFKPRAIGPSVQIPNSPTGGDVNFVYGGNKLVLLNAEYEFPILNAAGLRGVLFVDAGNAFAEDESMNLLKLRANWGFGARWFSPFGPLRFEWGLPFKRKPGEDRIVFQFTIGSSF